jgi:Bacteriophage head to tail connecting protein
MVGNLADRFRTLDAMRISKLYRARLCSMLTIPSILPPIGWTEQMELVQPTSSVGARGATSLASRMLSAMMPLNDTPFFKFGLRSGVEPTVEIAQYLETLSYQVYRKLAGTNLRESIYQAIQNLIIVGDCLFHESDDFKFRCTRLDHYVVQRTVEGQVSEVIFVEYDLVDPEAISPSFMLPQSAKVGYKKTYCQYVKQEDGTWKYQKEDDDGNLLSEGVYEVCPVTVLRWYGIPGENYGRSHCEDILGDLSSLDGYTRALLDGMAAASAFWMGIDPSGITEIDDIADMPNGAWVAARQQDIFTVSPSHTMNPQVSTAQSAMELMRREIGQAFLMSSSSIPSGDRVTATAVRMIGSELETVLGGAFSAIARDLMEPIVRRTVFLMIDNEELDKRMYEQFFDKDGSLSVEVITGLQALSRDTDLQKLMQMGEMVRNLPPEAAQVFKWDEYAKALITSLGFDSRNWVRSEQEIQAQQAAQQQQMAQLQAQQQMASATAGTAGNVMNNAANMDLQQNGGQGIMNVLRNSGGDPSIFTGGPNG